MSKIIAVKDGLATYKIEKEKISSLPAKIIINGRSQLSGKSTLIANLFLRPWGDDDVDGKDFYKNDFRGQDIYVVCPSIHLDPKWAIIVKAKKIPEANIYAEYDEDELTELYKRLEEQFYEERDAGGKINQRVIVFDDVGFTGKLKDKAFGIVAKIVSNGRHIAVSSVFVSQRYTQISTTVRSQATQVYLFECSNSELDLVVEDHSNMGKKQFIDMFRNATREKHSFMSVCYTVPSAERFMNSNFETIKYQN
jgi:hypothetical protein